MIVEEFAKAGLHFEFDRQQAPTIHEIFRRTVLDHTSVGSVQIAVATHLEQRSLGPMTLDGFDRERHVGFEYVSDQDYDLLSEAVRDGEQPESFAHLVARLRRALDRRGGNRIGVFDDPLAGRLLFGRDRYEPLRREVRAFIASLEGPPNATPTAATVPPPGTRSVSRSQ